MGCYIWTDKDTDITAFRRFLRNTENIFLSKDDIVQSCDRNNTQLMTFKTRCYIKYDVYVCQTQHKQLHI
jgi:hypothetical protein